MRHALRSRRAVPLLLLLLLAACRRDPEVLKKEALERGNAYFAQKQYAEATIEYRKALQTDSRYGEAYYQLGLTYELQGDRPNALKMLVRAADLLPARPEVQLKAGQSLLFARRFEEAKKIAEALLDGNARHIEAQLLLANARASLNDLGAAVAEVEEAIAQDPGHVASYSNLAALQLAAGNPEKARQAFANAITIAPRSIDARLGLANLQWAEGKLGEAETTLLEALRIEPGHPLGNRMLAALYLTSGRVADAERPLKAIADANKDFVAPRLALADYYLAIGRTPEGLRLLEEAARLSGGRGPATLRLAEYDFRAGQKQAAYQKVDSLIQAEPKNAQAHLVKAAFLLTEGRPDEALAQAKEAVADSPRLGRAQFAVGSIHLVRGRREEAAAAFKEALRLSPRFAPASLELARLSLGDGRPEQAVNYASEAVSYQPGNVEMREALVRALLARGDVDRATAELRPLLEQYGPSPRVQVLVGVVALSRGDRTAARKAFEQAMAAQPKNRDALLNLVSLDMQDGRRAEARRRIDARLALAPDAETYRLAATVYESLEAWGDAEKAWKAVVAKEPGSLEAYRGLGRLYYRQNRLADALAEAERLAAAKPKDVSAPVMAGFLLEMLGRPDEAQKRYEQALALDPRAAAAANNLAWMYAERGTNLDGALQLAQGAKVSLPESPEVSDTLGWIYLKKGMKEQAVVVLEEAVRRAPDRPAYHYHLGMAYLKANDWSRARASLKRALELDPAFAGASDARQALATIQ